MKKSCFIPDDRIYSLYAIILSLHIVLCNTIFPNKSSVYSLVAFASKTGVYSRFAESIFCMKAFSRPSERQ